MAEAAYLPRPPMLLLCDCCVRSTAQSPVQAVLNVNTLAFTFILVSRTMTTLQCRESAQPAPMAGQALRTSLQTCTGMEFGLQLLPKEVLLNIVGAAALPVGLWMTALPKPSNTEGLPEKPLSLETLKEQHNVPQPRPDVGLVVEGESIV